MDRSRGARGRYEPVATPLKHVQWWRVVMDEAQMGSSTVSSIGKSITKCCERAQCLVIIILVHAVSAHCDVTSESERSTAPFIPPDFMQQSHLSPILTRLYAACRGSGKMLSVIPGEHRWCVTGTPTSRGTLEDLHGLNRS